MAKNAATRMRHVRENMPRGYILLVEAERKYNVSRQTITNWIRADKIEILKIYGVTAIKETREFRAKCKDAVKRRKEKKKPPDENRYINSKGEITNWTKWLRALRAPTLYAIEFDNNNKVYHQSKKEK